ncbi:PIN domain-containing protein [Hydrogenophaga sp. UC242_53]|uniref:PIN domain-containing protein n=1 Tax=Hydrogenophaga sp. UC242_53 TaxID=3350170 RepID=UPI0036D2B356
MKEQHLLVDFENVQPGMEDLLKIAPKLTDVWLFHGPNQTKRAEQLKAAHERVTLVPHSGKGKNALDFHLSFYLGYLAAKHPEANLVVVANDKGYDSMLGHAKLLEFRATRVGFKARKAPAAKKAAPAKKVTAKKAAPAKKVAPPAKKLVAEKAPAKKVPAKTAVAEKSGDQNAGVCGAGNGPDNARSSGQGIGAGESVLGQDGEEPPNQAHFSAAPPEVHRGAGSDGRRRGRLVSASGRGQGHPGGGRSGAVSLTACRVDLRKSRLAVKFYIRKSRILNKCSSNPRIFSSPSSSWLGATSAGRMRAWRRSWG